MKKTILILTCWLLGLVPGMAQQRTITDIQQLADSVLNQPLRKGGVTRTKRVKTKNIVAASEILKGKQDAFYICDAGADGFAVISGDERMTPVLGFAQKGGFDVHNIPDGMQELLNCYAKEYEALTSGKPYRLSKRRRIEGVQDQVGPLLFTEWGQGEPFNNRCPEWEDARCITGCIAISTAQTIRYFQYPDSAKGEVKYETRTNKIPIYEDLSTFKFDWSNIKGSYKDGATTEECDAVANLVYSCAVAVNMDFGLKESSSNSYNQVLALVENFGYDQDIACIRKDYINTNDWQVLMLNELNNKRPIVYAAQSPTLGGHSFIIDGYKADEDAYPFYHVNWGWEGYCNNFFKLSSLDADGDEYSLGHEAIIYIQPENEERDAENFWQATEINLSTARINPNNTHKFSVTLKDIFNCSYKPFMGKMIAYLIDENDQEIQVGTSTRIYNTPFNYGASSITIQSTLPDDIAEGVYTLIVRSKADESDEMEMVTYSSQVTLTVTTITESYSPNIMIADLVNVGEDLQGDTVSLRATFPLNFAEKAFTGTLRMAVADSLGNIITQFGNVARINNLQQYYTLSVAYTFRGTIPDYLEDGMYRLYLAANQSGYLEWEKVTGYKDGSIGVDMYIPFWLEEGKIIYHKESEEELPEFYANIQATDIELTAFDADTRKVEILMRNILNFGDEPFLGHFTMILYNEAGEMLTEFGETQKWMTQPIGHYQMTTKEFKFSGNMPDDLEDGIYTIRIGAKQNGCQGWSPVKGWVMDSGYIMDRDIDLRFDFVFAGETIYQTDIDGISSVKNEQTEIKNGVYDLSGRKMVGVPSSGLRKGLYIINGKKVAIK